MKFFKLFVILVCFAEAYADDDCYTMYTFSGAGVLVRKDSVVIENPKKDGPGSDLPRECFLEAYKDSFQKYVSAKGDIEFCRMAEEELEEVYTSLTKYFVEMLDLDPFQAKKIGAYRIDHTLLRRTLRAKGG